MAIGPNLGIANHWSSNKTLLGDFLTFAAGFSYLINPIVYICLMPAIKVPFLSTIKMRDLKTGTKSCLNESHGGGAAVSVLAFDSDDPSLNPVDS